MDNAQNLALFGGNNPDILTAQMVNGSARDANDWATVLANGINGAVYNAINAKINGAYADGQLQVPITNQNSGALSGMNLLIIGAIFIMLMDKK